MFRKFAKKLFSKDTSQPAADGFFLDVRCNQCGEEFHLFINKSWDLMQNFGENGTVTYSLKKKVIGAGCRNVIEVNMEFDGNKKLMSRKIENGEFIEKKTNGGQR